jgi:hypothetical protein
MADAKYSWESFKAEGTSIVDKITELIHEGNVRRIVVEHEGRTVAEFPLSVGLVGVVLAPLAAALGALVAVLKDCTIHVERGAPTSAKASADRPDTGGEKPGDAPAAKSE